MGYRNWKLRSLGTQLFAVFPQPPVRLNPFPQHVQKLLVGRHDLFQAMMISTLLLLLVFPSAPTLTLIALLLYWSLVLIHRFLVTRDAKSTSFNSGKAHLMRGVIVVIGNTLFILALVSWYDFDTDSRAAANLWLLFVLATASVGKTANWRYTFLVTVLSCAAIMIIDQAGQPLLQLSTFRLASAYPKMVWLFALSTIMFVALYFLTDSRREFGLIQTLMLRASQTPSLEELLELVSSEVANYFGFKYVNILLREDDHLKIAWSNVEAGRDEIGYTLPIDNSSLNGQAALTKSVCISTTTRKSDAFRWVPFFPDTLCEMAAPLIVGGEVIGTLDIQDSRPDAFLPHQIDLLRETLPNSLALVLHNRIQKERIIAQASQIQDQATRLERVHRAMNTIARYALSGIRPPDLLHKIVKLGKEVMEATSVVAFLLEDTGDALRIIGGPVYSGDFLVGRPNKPDGTDTAVHRLALYREPFFAENVRSLDAITVLGGGSSKVGAEQARFLVREELESVAALPIILGDEKETARILGVIFFNYRERRTLLTATEQEPYITFVALSSLAIDVAQRTSETQLIEREDRWLRMHNLYLNRLLVSRALLSRVKVSSTSNAVLSELESELRDLEGYLRFEAEGMRLKSSSKTFPEQLRDLVRVLRNCFPDVEFLLEFLDPYPDMPSWVDERLERFAREAVINALRHAEPDKIWITLGRTQDTFFVEVEDDGTGFNLRSDLRKSGRKALEMEAGALNGDFSIDTGAKGTIVRLRFSPEHVV